MTPIQNIETYNDGMRRALYDKLFFVDKINPSCIVDFGCADGTLMREIASYYPNTPIFGVDDSQDMRDMVTDFEVYPSLERITPIKGSALILSSVLHELYSYSDRAQIQRFWELANRFDYIVIRDMAIAESCLDYPVYRGDVAAVKRAAPEKVNDFEGAWGKLNYRLNMMHFLLKYRYENNWDRELFENYLPNTKEALIHLASPQRTIVYQDHYVLPFLKEKWNEDFGIEVTTPTHLKLIAKRI